MADLDRPRSFIERYVIARAASFTPGKSRDEAGAAILEARAVYRQIALVAKSTEPNPVQNTLQGAGSGVVAGPYQTPQARAQTRPPVSGMTAQQVQEMYHRMYHRWKDIDQRSDEIALRQAFANQMHEEKGYTHGETPKAYNPDKAV